MRYFRRKYRKPSASESKLTKIQVEIARSDFHRPGILV
nr:MAG TPA: GTP-binding GTPase [Caudoviricetes sp.]